jgi:hypothetical protein
MTACGGKVAREERARAPGEGEPGEEEKNFTKSFSLLFEPDTPGFFLRSFGETEPPNFVPLRIRPVRSIT